MAFPAILPIPPHTIPNRHNKPLHSLRHAGAPTSARTLCTDTRYHRRTGRCTAQRRPPIIIMYIRARRCYGSMPDGAADHRPCQRGGVSSCRLRIRWQVLAHCQQYRLGAPAEGSASPPVQGQPGGLQSGTGSAVRPGILVLSTRRGSPAAGARNHWRLPPQLFSGFRPIANRGQQ